MHIFQDIYWLIKFHNKYQTLYIKYKVKSKTVKMYFKIKVYFIL